MVTITGRNPLPLLIEDWDEDAPNLNLELPDEIEDSSDEDSQEFSETEYAEKLYSEPDMKKFVPVRKRRRTRRQVSEAEMEEICNGYVDWFNGLDQEKFWKICTDTLI